MSLSSVVIAKVHAYDQAQAESFAVGAGLAAVEAQPGQGDTKWATGRQRMSTTSSPGKSPKRHDAGLLSSYQIPGKSEFLRGIKGRRPFEDVHVAMGARSEGGFFYGPVVERFHHPMERALPAGIAAVRSDRVKNVRRAARAR